MTGTGTEIEISIYSKDEFQLKGLGVFTPSENNLWEKRTFWKVDYAYVNMDNKNHTTFWIGDESFVSNITYKEFIKLF